ncbi:hypothetical protein [Streptomyces sp. 8L]|uniref:hypothetical protein n=1 Tax=Streptomyces sp. 8L TaxID=2877242 RepID=UPI001CD1B9CC|nr:hypothetical protein [Streptomyces sp. 8L]MCA1222940.1 hypothetical protein [Streptomyces sp. 8L]
MIEQSPQRGRQLSTRGWIAITLGGAFLADYFEEPGWLLAVQECAGLILIIVGVRAVLLGRKHLTRVLPSLQSAPTNERIVLFLRAFSDDAGFSRTAATRLRGLRLMTGLIPTAADIRTEEEQVARAVAPFGRMVALGSPSDQLPPLGADRSYASDETWQAEVLAALSRASLVLLAAGAGRSLAWEVDQVVRHNDPTRLVLVVGHDQRQYAQFRESLGPIFPQGLPEYPVAEVRQRILRGLYARAVIWFDDDWTPHLEILSGRFPLINFGRRTQNALRRALGNVYQRAGVPTRVTPATARPWEVKFSITLIVMFWFGLGAWFSTFILFGVIASHKFQGLTIIPIVFCPLWAGLAIWMYRVWRGGPYAIMMARLHGIIAPIITLMLTIFAVIMLVFVPFFPHGVLAFAFLLAFGVVLLGLGVVGMPLAAVLLHRYNVVEWVDSRL